MNLQENENLKQYKWNSEHTIWLEKKSVILDYPLMSYWFLLHMTWALPYLSTCQIVNLWCVLSFFFSFFFFFQSRGSTLVLDFDLNQNIRIFILCIKQWKGYFRVSPIKYNVPVLPEYTIFSMYIYIYLWSSDTIF